MELKPGYKQTEVGVVPEEWAVTPIGKAGEVLGGRQRSPHAIGSLCKYLRVANVFDGFLETEDVLEMPFSAAEKEHFLLKAGDVLLNEGQSIELVGRSAIYRGIPDNCCFQNTLVRFRAGRETCVEFAQLVFQQYLRLGVFSSIASQTTSIAHLGTGRLAALKMPLPPLPEQRAIAGALGDVDALIGALDQLIAKKRDLKQAAMQQLLTGQKRLPGFSGRWSTYTFGELFDLLRNASNSRADLVADGKVGYLHYGDIHIHDSQFFDCGRDLRTFISADKVRSTPLMADGDLVMVDASEDTEAIGKAVEITGLNGRGAVAGLHTLLLRSKGGRLADGFKGYLQNFSAVREALVRMATGVSVYGISKSNVRTISLAVPDIDEQKAIAAVLSDMDAELAALEQRLAKTRDLKQGMMQELLTGRTRLI